MSEKMKKEEINLPLTTDPLFKHSVDAKVIEWLRHQAPAVSGHGGHDRTFSVACTLVHGFELEKDEALPFLLDWNQFCEPPWSKDELWHKLDDAYDSEPLQPPGYMLRKYFPGTRQAWMDEDLIRLSWSKAIYLPVHDIDPEKAIFLPDHSDKTSKG